MKKKRVLILAYFALLFLSFQVVRAQNAGDIYQANIDGFVSLNEEYIVKKLAATSAPTITGVSVSGDIATIKASGTVGAYYVGYGSDNVSNAKSYGTTSRTFYVSVKNGTYYFWVYGGSTSTGSLRPIRYSKAVNVSSSCKNEKKLNQTGSGTVERCWKVTSSGAKPDIDETFLNCANGYKLSTSVKSNGCKGTIALSVNGQVLNQRYCKAVYSYSCTKQSSGGGGSGGGGGGSKKVAAASLKSLSVSDGSLSPGFSSGTTNYTVNVGSNVSSIKISATAASGSSFVSGYGSRTVDLSYGSNTAVIKVKNSAGKTTSYNITINRQDNRSNVNTLSSLTISVGELSPAFAADVTSYSVKVTNDVTAINVGATLSDNKSSFVSGFGDRTVDLNVGDNVVLVKVKSESGKENTYTITVVREDLPAECSANPDKFGLLKEIDLSSNFSTEDNVAANLNFDPAIKTYDITVPYAVANLIVNAYVQDEGDTAVVNGGTNLNVGTENPNSVTITVSSKMCPNVTNVYTLNVVREEEKALGDDASLKSLSIKNHSEVKFEVNKSSYEIHLAKGEKNLSMENFVYVPVNEGTVCQLSNNTALSVGSDVLLTCEAESGEKTVYNFKVTKVAKGMNTFLVILLVIIALLVLVYIILRLLGYRIYFNFGMITAFFRGLGEKIKNIFD